MLSFSGKKGVKNKKKISIKKIEQKIFLLAKKQYIAGIYNHLPMVRVADEAPDEVVGPGEYVLPTLGEWKACGS